MTTVDRRALDSQGYALGPIKGGPRYQTYYTPDGREVKALPSMREWVRKNSEGKIVEQGTRDANLDQGWLTSPPGSPKPYCVGCGKWHDSEAQVSECVTKKKRTAVAWEKRVKAQLKQGSPDTEEFEGRLGNLEQAVGEVQGSIGSMEAMLKALLARE
jgi:hypothetical protein